MNEGQLILERKLGFDKVRSMVEAHCQSDYAASLCGRETFVSDADEIRRRLTLTDEMRLILMFEENFPTGGYIDSLDFLLPLRQANSSMDLVAMRKFRTMLETLSKLQQFFAGVPSGVYPNLRKLTLPVASFPSILHKIDNILDRYGAIRDNASPQLFEIRKSLSEKMSQISRRANAVLRHAQEAGIVDSDASVVVRDARMLIPVPAAQKRALQGFIYDESASGKTVFLEPAEVVELSNEVKDLQFAQQREIVRILFEFSEFVRPYVEDLVVASEYMGTMDFIMAKAQVALDMKAGMPVFSDDGSINLRKARHPLLEKALQRENRQMVPVSVSLDRRKRILLVSGPNAGGKSVCLKTVGLLQYMFQWGLLIPTSESSEMVVFKTLMVEIGDDQNLENDLSTYSSFLSNMREMLSGADDSTMVLIDEFGSGTEPAAGGAIAEAILARLEKLGVYGVINTHYTNLKVYASRGESAVINGAMAFDAVNIQPLYKLEIGLPGNSFAFEMARKMGLPEEVVKDAEERAGDEFVGMERNLRKIARSRKALDEKLERVSRADRTLEDITGKYHKELSDIKKLKEDILQKAREEAEAIVSGANREVEKTIRTIKEAQAEKEPTVQARRSLADFLTGLETAKSKQDEYLERKLKQLEERQARNEARKAQRSLDKKIQEDTEARIAREREESFRNAPLKVGEKVRVKDNGMVGEVSKINGKNLILLIGNISTKVASARVERITSNEFKSAAKELSKPQSTIVTDSSIRERKLNFHTEIDLRGERLQDAIDKVMHYVDDAIMLGVPSVRIIHGRGTGVLHEEIQKYLRTVPGVSSVADEHIQLGGSGVTVVRFD